MYKFTSLMYIYHTRSLVCPEISAQSFKFVLQAYIWLCVDISGFVLALCYIARTLNAIINL